jgi:hypothetical protein
MIHAISPRSAECIMTRLQRKGLNAKRQAWGMGSEIAADLERCFDRDELIAI